MAQEGALADEAHFEDLGYNLSWEDLPTRIRSAVTEDRNKKHTLNFQHITLGSPGASHRFRVKRTSHPPWPWLLCELGSLEAKMGGASGEVFVSPLEWSMACGRQDSLSDEPAPFLLQ